MYYKLLGIIICEPLQKKKVRLEIKNKYDAKQPIK